MAGAHPVFRWGQTVNLGEPCLRCRLFSRIRRLQDGGDYRALCLQFQVYRRGHLSMTAALLPRCFLEKDQEGNKNRYPNDIRPCLGMPDPIRSCTQGLSTETARLSPASPVTILGIYAGNDGARRVSALLWPKPDASDISGGCNVINRKMLKEL